MAPTRHTTNPRTNRKVSSQTENTIQKSRYSAEEIRFNLLAIAQRPLPILESKLQHLTSLQNEIQSNLDTLVPEWSIFTDAVPTADIKIDSSLIAKTLQNGDATELLSLKKALDRDIAITKLKVKDEEEKISQYMEYVTRRRHDYSGFIRCMLTKLAEKELIKGYLTS
jgi:hypothetical protein